MSSVSELQEHLRHPICGAAVLHHLNACQFGFDYHCGSHRKGCAQTSTDILYQRCRLQYGKLKQETPLMSSRWEKNLVLLGAGLICSPLPCSGKGGLEVLQHNHDVLSIAFRPDGKLLASATLDGQIYFWNPQEAVIEASRPLLEPKREQESAESHT